jgi:hypothetical protein
MKKIKKSILLEADLSGVVLEINEGDDVLLYTHENAHEHSDFLKVSKHLKVGRLTERYHRERNKQFTVDGFVFAIDDQTLSMLTEYYLMSQNMVRDYIRVPSRGSTYNMRSDQIASALTALLEEKYSADDYIEQKKLSVHQATTHAEIEAVQWDL